MTLSDLAAIGSFINGVAVLISLVFLYFQVRQVSEQVRKSEKNQQAAIRAGRAGRTTQTQMGVATEPSLADAVSKGMAGSPDLSSIQLAQFQWFCRATFHHIEELFYQHSEAQLDEASFKAVVASMRNWFSAPGYRAAWRRLHRVYGSEFVAFTDRLIAETPLSPSLEPTLQWKEDLAAVNAL